MAMAFAQSHPVLSASHLSTHMELKPNPEVRTMFEEAILKAYEEAEDAPATEEE